ncbi:MAG: hypothetical protein H7A23_11250 [Leptospiraceae bacterium]|nr:hypothetical protein [Leptospiraceae bacterium]MCP5495121.1 hypothetical protein [Leptospiraceae bacterium]
MEQELSFEKIWLLFQETDKEFKETSRKFQETDRKFQETDRKFQETDKRIRKLDRLFTGQWGKLMESLVEGDLIELLRARGISVNQTSQRLKTRYNNQDFEIDIVAKNGIEVVFVEIKTTLTPEDVEHFFKKLQIIKSVFSEYTNNTVYGAMAFLRSESDAALRAERKGMFVIRATGKSASIINSVDFQPVVF